MEPLLLDTCAALWIGSGAPITPAASNVLAAAYEERLGVYVSPMTAWEVGMLVAKGRISLSARPEVWFGELLATPGIRLADLSPQILILSSFLPDSPLRDATDRIIATTARERGFTLMTRDRHLLDYAARGHIQAIEC